MSQLLLLEFFEIQPKKSPSFSGLGFSRKCEQKAWFMHLYDVEKLYISIKTFR